MSQPTKATLPLNTLLDRHFLTCSAAVTGVVITLPGPSASGAIVYSGTQNLPIFALSVNGGVYFDLEPPFATAQGSRPTGWDFNPYDFGKAMYVNGNTMLVLAGANVANLAANTLIDGSSSFSAGGFAGPVNIPEGGTGYMGFKFDPDGIAGAQTFYGWVQMKVGGSSAGDGNIVAWAYDDSGAGIRTGTIPEPSSLVLLALGAAGVATWRQRRPV